MEFTERKSIDTPWGKAVTQVAMNTGFPVPMAARKSVTEGSQLFQKAVQVCLPPDVLFLVSSPWGFESALFRAGDTNPSLEDLQAFRKAAALAGGILLTGLHGTLVAVHGPLLSRIRLMWHLGCGGGPEPMTAEEAEQELRTSPLGIPLPEDTVFCDAPILM